MFLAHSPAGVLRFTADQVQVPCSSSGAPVALTIGRLSSGSLLKAEKPTGGVANYYLGRDKSRWIEGIPLERPAASLQERSPNVDMVFHGETGSLEYDLEVEPGGDPSLVNLEVGKGGSFRLEADGSATVQTVGSSECKSLHLLSPAAYQTVNGRRVDVRSRFALNQGGKLFSEVWRIRS